jgi:hypothetical protein
MRTDTWAVPVAARVVSDSLVAAAIASFEMGAERSRSAQSDSLPAPFTFERTNPHLGRRTVGLQHARDHQRLLHQPLQVIANAYRVPLGHEDWRTPTYLSRYFSIAAVLHILRLDGPYKLSAVRRFLIAVGWNGYINLLGSNIDCRRFRLQHRRSATHFSPSHCRLPCGRRARREALILAVPRIEIAALFRSRHH